MNRADSQGVSSAVISRAPAPVRAGRPELRRARAAAPGFSRFLTLSIAVHVAIVAAGITGGAAYVRRSGAEGTPALIVIASTPEPLTTSSLATSSAEPERQLENQDSSQEPEPSPLAPEGMEAEARSSDSFASAAESFMGAVESKPQSAATSLDRVIGDPRSSWRLPSLSSRGLHLGLANEPRIADCCGEPQPGPIAASASDIYVYPEVLKMARAEFPVKSQRLGEQGSVLLEMTVGADGLVKDVRIAESSGHSRIDDCAVAAAWDWNFKPATRNGVPEASLARHRYTFRLLGSGG